MILNFIYTLLKKSIYILSVSMQKLIIIRLLNLLVLACYKNSPEENKGKDSSLK